ncbi:MAG: YccF domain-containing protein [Salinivirgaceae bacterium]|nr:YccF domain-containing protein [Salinivirgaceae bacterium]MDD4747870.1 YccF domain-containing protein [Salinivirgaceae bacterium]MDY0279946.1 YccF domain-containing protein [Salinivirgaceae bacterium]
MRTLANILWHFPFMGFLSAFGTFLIGLLLIITIIGAPIGLGLLELARYLLTPFSSRMISERKIHKRQNKLWFTYGFLVRILYFPFGLVLAVVTIVQIVGLCITIIGIPLAIVLAKSLGTYFNPVNKVCVSRKFADEIEYRNARQRM